MADVNESEHEIKNSYAAKHYVTFRYTNIFLQNSIEPNAFIYDKNVGYMYLQYHANLKENISLNLEISIPYLGFDFSVVKVIIVLFFIWRDSKCQRTSMSLIFRKII